MNKLSLTIALLLLFFYVKAQTYKPVTIIKGREYSLSSGASGAFAGGSREVIKIDLPPNTKRWYYSFTTTKGPDETKLLNLGLQVSAALASGGLSAAVASKIQIPPGVEKADVLLLAPEFREAFLKKKEVRYFPDVSVQNAKQATQAIENSYGNSFYIGLRNPLPFGGINIFIEVVAIVEEVSSESEKGTLYGTMGWTAFENGDYEKCVLLSKKALTFNKNLGWVKFNIDLVHLIQEKDQAIDEYINTMSELKSDLYPKDRLVGALKDIQNLKVKKPNLKNLKEVENLLMIEMKKY